MTVLTSRLVPLTALAAVLWISACDGSPEERTSDSGSTPMPDAAAPAPPPDTTMAPSSTCDVAAPPSPLPSLAGAIEILGPGESEPSATGGDPIGAWAAERVTVYLPAVARGLVDPAASSITGTGWGRFDESGGFVMAFDLELVIETTSAGTVRRPGDSRSRGTYVVDGSELIVTPECTSSPAPDGAGGRLGFSRDGDTATLIVPMEGMMGRAVLVASLRSLD